MLLIAVIMMIFFIIVLLMGISLVLANKTNFNREKSSPFECGFDPNLGTRLPFSLRFFLITIIFLIFDVEVVLLLPCIKTLVETPWFYWWTTTSLFIIILLFGLFHEWNQGALKWSF